MALNRNHFAEFFRCDYNTVQVTFDDTPERYPSHGKQYTYKASKDDKIAAGDKVLVFANDQYKIVTVHAVNENPAIDGAASFNYKWIVGPISALLEKHQANVDKDLRLKKAVATLEASLAKVRLRKEIAAAMDELPAEEMAQIKELFGADLCLPNENKSE